MDSLSRKLRAAGCIVLVMMLMVSVNIHAASSILIWPIDPVLEADQQASALWLENRGKEAASLQIRVFAWNQHDLSDQYRNQREVIGSPPVARIEPGQKQLVRLTRVQEVPPGEEWAYRIVVDEIPSPPPVVADHAGKPAAAIQLQMRYSIPLFVYGTGLRSRDTVTPAAQGQAGSALSWRDVVVDDRAYVEVRNRGPLHARLTDVSFQQDGQDHPLVEGLLGYVLPGSIMRWPLPQRLASKAVLQARVNGADAVQSIAPTR